MQDILNSTNNYVCTGQQTLFQYTALIRMFAYLLEAQMNMLNLPDIANRLTYTAIMNFHINCFEKGYLLNS
jgi:hypothetical protein